MKIKWICLLGSFLLAGIFGLDLFSGKPAMAQPLGVGSAGMVGDLGPCDNEICRHIEGAPLGWKECVTGPLNCSMNFTYINGRFVSISCTVATCFDVVRNPDCNEEHCQSNLTKRGGVHCVSDGDGKHCSVSVFWLDDEEWAICYEKSCNIPAP